MYFVYILRNEKNILYKGITNNLQRRLAQHNRNKAIGTRGKGPWKIIYHETLPDRISARKREKYFKSGIGREELAKLVIK